MIGSRPTAWINGHKELCSVSTYAGHLNFRGNIFIKALHINDGSDRERCAESSATAVSNGIIGTNGGRFLKGDCFTVSRDRFDDIRTVMCISGIVNNKRVAGIKCVESTIFCGSDSVFITIKSEVAGGRGIGNEGLFQKATVCSLNRAAVAPIVNQFDIAGLVGINRVVRQVSVAGCRISDINSVIVRLKSFQCRERKINRGLIGYAAAKKIFAVDGNIQAIC